MQMSKEAIPAKANEIPTVQRGKQTWLIEVYESYLRTKNNRGTQSRHCGFEAVQFYLVSGWFLTFLTQLKGFTNSAQVSLEGELHNRLQLMMKNNTRVKEKSEVWSFFSSTQQKASFKGNEIQKLNMEEHKQGQSLN